jgi:hypothetical protein
VLNAGDRLHEDIGFAPNLSIPRQDTTSEINWGTENQVFSTSNFTFDGVQVNFSQASATLYFSNQLLQQATISESILDVVKDDLLGAMATAIDEAAIAGTGVNQPVGLLNMPVGSGYAYVNSVTFATTPAAWSDIVGLEETLGNQSIWQNDSKGAIVTTPAVKAKWKQTPKTPTTLTNGFLWENKEDIVNGYRGIASTQVPSNRVIFSTRWSELMVFLASGVSILTDKFSAAHLNQTRCVVDALVGVICRHSNAFAISTNAGA